MKPVFGFIAFVVVVVFIIVMVVRSGNDNTANLAPAPELSSAADSTATFNFTEDGPVVADEDHYRIRISVGRSTRNIEIIQGYQNTIVASQSFANNKEAFSQFLSALDRAGYAGERSTKFTTEEGICPNGSRFIFESDQFSEDFRRWTTSCDERGSFGGAFSATRQLYQNQIPEYRKFINDTRRATGLSL